MSRPHFTLQPIAPFRLDLTVWTLRRRPGNIVDRWDGETYRRVLPLDGGPAEICVTQARSGERPRLEVRLVGRRPSAAVKTAVTSALARMLGIRTDLTDFYRRAEQQPRLNELVVRFRGMKPPRFPTVFEALINAIACQQVTLSLGIQLLNKVAARDGLGVNGASAFPRPEDLAAHRPEEFRLLGFSRQKGRSMIELAQETVAGRLDLESLIGIDDATAVKQLTGLRGIGRWSAEYALLRGLGRTHIFPGDDVGARNRLRQLLGRRREFDYEAVARALRHWQPYAGLVYFHMLLAGLAEAQLLDDSA